MRISDWSSDVCSSDLTVPKPSPTGSSTSWPAPPRRSTPAKPHPRRPSLFRDAALIAGKDLRIELRSQVTTQQVAPFSILVLILFDVALDPDRGFLARAREIGRASLRESDCHDLSVPGVADLLQKNKPTTTHQ